MVQDTNLAAMFERVASSEYNMRWIEDQSVYKSANRAQNLRFTYYADGFAVEPRDYGLTNPRPWEITLRLQAFGKSADQGQTIANARWTVSENTASGDAGSIVIEYKNDRAGLRQNFRLPAQPPGASPLQLNFVAQTAELELRSNAHENFVYFIDPSGQEVLRYTDLQAWDSAGAELEARMVKLDPARFAIVVNDDAAVYPVLVDPLVMEFYTNATQTGEQFGYAVAAPGWVAGYPSSAAIMIGAPGYDNGAATDAGAVFVNYSTDYNPPTLSWHFVGDQGGGHLGASVANAGALYGGGYNGIVVGAPSYSSGGYSWNGRVYAFAGSANGPYGPVWSNSGGTNYMQYGQTVCGIQNIFNSSLYGGFAVGAPNWTGAGQAGLIDVYQWGPNGPLFVCELTGSSPWWALGSSLAAGSVNGDFIPDLIAGARNKGTGAPDHVVVYYGTFSGFSGSTTLSGENDGDDFGHSVAVVGDVNGDTYNDLLVGAPGYYSPGKPDPTGKAYIYCGGPSGVGTTPYWSVAGGHSGEQMGFSVSGGPVQNGQGAPVPCLVIGAPNYSFPGMTQNGGAYFYVVTNGVPGYDTTVSMGASYNHLGWSVAYDRYILYGECGIIVGAPFTAAGGAVSAWKYYNP